MSWASSLPIFLVEMLLSTKENHGREVIKILTCFRSPYFEFTLLISVDRDKADGHGVEAMSAACLPLFQPLEILGG